MKIHIYIFTYIYIHMNKKHCDILSLQKKLFSLPNFSFKNS